MCRGEGCWCWLACPHPPPDDMSIVTQLWFLSPSNKSNTLPLATRYNIKCVGLSPDGRLAIIVDEGNRLDWGQVW